MNPIESVLAAMVTARSDRMVCRPNRTIIATAFEAVHGVWRRPSGHNPIAEGHLTCADRAQNRAYQNARSGRCRMIPLIALSDFGNGA
jgi:hypothetical protein